MASKNRKLEHRGGNVHDLKSEQMGMKRTGEPSYFAAIPVDDRKNTLQRISNFVKYGAVPNTRARASDDISQSLQENSSWQQTLIMAAVYLLWCLDVPLAILGNIVEFTGNVWVANGGLFRSVWRFLLTALFLFQKWFLIVPAKTSEDYRSIIGLIDSRTALFEEKENNNSNSGISSVDDERKRNNSTNADPGSRRSGRTASSFPGPDHDHGSRRTGDVMVMAAKLAYENAAVCRKVVSDDWGMHFVRFFNCWNEFQKKRNTQVLLFTEKPKNAKAIVIAWRGTEPFNAYDWSTDIDLSWHEIEGLGKVHIGFLEALGLVDRNDVSSFHTLRDKRHENRKQNQKWFASPNMHEADVDQFSSLSSLTSTRGVAPKAFFSASSMSGLSQNVIDDLDETPLAYDAVSARVRRLLVFNPEAKLYITGHSLGGALAALYTAMLIHNEENDLVSRIASVYTFGAPRVGDEKMAAVMTQKLLATTTTTIKARAGAATDATMATTRPGGTNATEQAEEDGESGTEATAAGAITIGFYRVVYCNDLVPRVPFDDPIFNFRHWGPCFYFNSLFKSQTIHEVPNKNFFRVVDILVMHLNAAWELFHNLFLPHTYGPEFQESFASILYRALALWVPGIGGHSPVNYVNAMRLGSPSPLVVKISDEIDRLDRAELREAAALVLSDLSNFFMHVQRKIGIPFRTIGIPFRTIGIPL